MAGAEVIIGLPKSTTSDGKVKQCGLISVCPAAGLEGQATVGIQKLYSKGELNSEVRFQDVLQVQ